MQFNLSYNKSRYFLPFIVVPGVKNYNPAISTSYLSLTKLAKVFLQACRMVGENHTEGVAILS